MTREEQIDIMTRNEEIDRAWRSYKVRSNYRYDEKSFKEGAEWADRTMIEKACRCYCDDICDKGRCCMCFHKHDGKGQVKNNFQYNECNELKLIRKAMEE
jgi:hypothetical protein